jgi:hypothetical protein
VLLDGAVVGATDRNSFPGAVTWTSAALDRPRLDVLVHAMGRVNFNCHWDAKGLTSPLVALDGLFPFLCGVQAGSELELPVGRKGPDPATRGLGRSALCCFEFIDRQAPWVVRFIHAGCKAEPHGLDSAPDYGLLSNYLE